MSVAAQPVLENYPYKTETTCLVPYLEGVNGGEFPEGYLLFLYQKAKEQGLVNRIFPGAAVAGATAFLRQLANKPIVIGLVRKLDKYLPAGVGWLHEVAGLEGARKASLGFMFFREWWGSKSHPSLEIHEIAEMALRWWYEELKVNVLYGSTLKRNRLAIRFGRAMGFRSLCDLPLFFHKGGQLMDGHLMVQTREEFRCRNLV